MRFFVPLFLLASLLFIVPAAAQNTDSLSRSVDSSARAIQEAANNFRRWKDSVERERIFRHVERNGKSLDLLLQEKREQEEKSRRSWYIRLGLGFVFLVALAVGLTRRKKGRRNAA